MFFCFRLCENVIPFLACEPCAGGLQLTKVGPRYPDWHFLSTVRRLTPVNLVRRSWLVRACIPHHSICIFLFDPFTSSSISYPFTTFGVWNFRTSDHPVLSAHPTCVYPLLKEYTHIWLYVYDLWPALRLSAHPTLCLTCPTLVGCSLQLPNLPEVLPAASWLSSTEIQALFFFTCQVLSSSSLQLNL